MTRVFRDWPIRRSGGAQPVVHGWSSCWPWISLSLGLPARPRIARYHRGSLWAIGVASRHTNSGEVRPAAGLNLVIGGATDLWVARLEIKRKKPRQRNHRIHLGQKLPPTGQPSSSHRAGRERRGCFSIVGLLAGSKPNRADQKWQGFFRRSKGNRPMNCKDRSPRTVPAFAALRSRLVRFRVARRFGRLQASHPLRAQDLAQSLTVPIVNLQVRSDNKPR